MQNTGKTPPDALNEQWLPHMPPLVVSWRGREALTIPERAGALLEVCYGGAACTFVATYRKGWNERDFQSALAALRGVTTEAPAQTPRRAANRAVYPLVVLPYLSDEKIAELERQQMSGLDYCGNGVLIVPDRWFIRSTGQPNRFRREQILQNPYLGKASLVGPAIVPDYRQYHGGTALHLGHRFQ